MKAQAITNITPGSRNILAQADPRAKILFLLYASVLSVLLDSIWALGTLAAVCLLNALLSGLSARQLAWTGLAVALVTWGSMFSQAIFYYGEPSTVLFNLVERDNSVLGWITGEMNVYREGFLHGAIQSLRFSSMMVLGLALCWSTDARGLLQGLLGIRTPYILAFMAVTALRFLPGIVREAVTVKQAWKVRGMSLFSLNPFHMALNWIRFLRPIFINGYRKSFILAMSLQSRAFSPKTANMQRAMPPMSGLARLFCWLGFLCVAGLLCIKILFWLYLGGIYYNTSLRCLYMFCRYYL